MTLTANERKFLARKHIADTLGELPPIWARNWEGVARELPTLAEYIDQDWSDEDLTIPARPGEQPGYTQTEIDGYRLALEDLEKQRNVVEEAAAYAYLFGSSSRHFTAAEQRDLKKTIRGRLADPVERGRLARLAGLYDRLDLVE